MGSKLSGDEMKVYLGIDMAKGKFDYCSMADTINILCRGSNKENINERFRELSDLIRTLRLAFFQSSGSPLFHDSLALPIPFCNRMSAFLMQHSGYHGEIPQEHITFQIFKNYHFDLP